MDFVESMDFIDFLAMAMVITKAIGP